MDVAIIDVPWNGIWQGHKKIPAASRRGILDAFEKSLAKLNSIFAPRGGVLSKNILNKINDLREDA